MTPAPLHLFLIGTLDHVALSALFEQIEHNAAGPVILDLRDAEKITPRGLRAWIPSICQLSRTRPMRIEACSPELVRQAAGTLDLFGQAEVASCMAPYYCPTCNHTESVMISASDLSGSGAPPTHECSQCGGETEFDELDSFLEPLRR